MNRGFGASGGVGLEALADEHDEHRLGGGQVFADAQGGDSRDADRQVGGDAFFEELADGAGERPIARDESQEDRRIDSEDRREQPSNVKEEKDADCRRKADVLDPLPRVPVDGMVFANDVQRSSR